MRHGRDHGLDRGPGRHPLPGGVDQSGQVLGILGLRGLRARLEEERTLPVAQELGDDVDERRVVDALYSSTGRRSVDDEELSGAAVTLDDESTGLARPRQQLQHVHHGEGVDGSLECHV